MRTILKIKLAGFLVLAAFIAKADEGMWMPQLIEALNFKDMKKNGFKLTAKDIYDINKASMKDAVAIFGGGCTAEVISDKGLILTNHHCGYDQIQAHSTVENDLLTNSFLAMKQSEELTNPNMSATLIVRMEDVTSKVLNGITDEMNNADRDKKINDAIATLQKEAVAGTHYGAFIRPFFYGNEYYLFVTETFKDVR